MDHTFTGRRVVRCVVYVRISEDREGGGLGVARQTEDCQQLARQLSTSEAEYRIVEVFEDNDLSAYSGKPRPGYRRMLDVLRRKEADCVLSWHTDRLHRSPVELEEYIDVCERIETRTVKAGSLDLSTATGRMIARQLGVQARYEVERMVERQKRKREELAAAGKFLGGGRPFGWEADGVTPVEAEFAAIREAASSVLAGVSRLSIARTWNKAGFLTSRDKKWTSNGVRGMLLRPRNAGIQVHRDEEVGAAIWEAPLDEPTWRSVVAYLRHPERQWVPQTERRFLGSGLYVCGRCGETMRSNQTRPKGKQIIKTYECRTSSHLTRNAQLLDDHVQLAIVERLSRPDAADLMVRPNDPVDVKGAQADLREARETLDELAVSVGAGEMDVRSWKVASAAARERMRAAEALLEQAVRINPAVELIGGDAAASWNALDLSRRRAVLASMATVTLLPARKGRGWDATAVRIDWK